MERQPTNNNSRKLLAKKGLEGTRGEGGVSGNRGRRRKAEAKLCHGRDWAREVGLSGKDLEPTSEEKQLPSEILPEIPWLLSSSTHHISICATQWPSKSTWDPTDKGTSKYSPQGGSGARFENSVQVTSPVSH